MMSFRGLTIVFDANVLETTKERLFPESKHRSKRIHKKLIKRFGGEFRRVPAMFLIKGQLWAHPALRDQIKAQLEAANR